MITEIPAKKIVTCDICKRVCDNKLDGVLRRQSGILMVKRDALDWYGSPVANGDFTFDLCDSCLDEIIAAINEIAKEKDGGLE